VYKIQHDIKVVDDGNLSNNVLKITVGENNGCAGYSSEYKALQGAWNPPSTATSDIDKESVDVTSAMGWATQTTTGTFTFDESDTHVFIGGFTDDVLDSGYIGIDNVQIKIDGDGAVVRPATTIK